MGDLVIKHFPNFFDLPLSSRVPTPVHAGGSRRLAQPSCLPSTEKPLCPRVKHGDGMTSIWVKLISSFLRCRPNLHQASILSTRFNLFHATSYLNISNSGFALTQFNWIFELNTPLAWELFWDLCKTLPYLESKCARWGGLLDLLTLWLGAVRVRWNAQTHTGSV
jgi:hypothetical protein